MRTIKFRVWDKHLKKFVKGDLFFEQEDQGTFEPDCYHDEDGEIHSMKFCQRKLDRYHGYIIQQFTGLKDKNGVEIYEGDIVRAWNQGSSHVGEIRWRLEAAPVIFIYPAYHDGKSWFLHGTKTKEGDYVDTGVEIIGNILENSELLKQ